MASFLNVLKEVVGILNESRKLFLKNKKLMFSVLVFPLFLNGLVYLFNVFAIKPEITNLIQESSLIPMMDPSSPEYLAHLMRVFEDFRHLVVSSYIFATVSSIINLLSVLVIVHASALTHKDDDVPIKDFPALTLKSWKGPLVTYFYIVLFTLGYWFIFLIILFPLLLLSTNFGSLAAKSGALFVLFAVFESYLAIVWYLSLVISILEETYGIQALGKAAKIAKGMKPKLFILNLFFGLLSFCFTQIVRRVDLNRSFGVALTTGLVLMSLIAAVRMFQLVTYTVAYFQCKSLQGKDVESLRDVKYSKLSSTSLIGALP
ncbi:Transmembrane protein [Hirschfeldia incana]|nr:Transmembrane protein [Hirschfeldia incana]